MTPIPWAMLVIASFGGVMLWLIIREAKSGAVNQHKANEQAKVERLSRAINETHRVLDGLSDADKRERLLDKYSRD